MALVDDLEPEQEQEDKEEKKNNVYNHEKLFACYVSVTTKKKVHCKMKLGFAV